MQSIDFYIITFGLDTKFLSLNKAHLPIFFCSPRFSFSNRLGLLSTQPNLFIPSLNPKTSILVIWVTLKDNKKFKFMARVSEEYKILWICILWFPSSQQFGIVFVTTILWLEIIPKIFLIRRKFLKRHWHNYFFKSF